MHLHIQSVSELTRSIKNLLEDAHRFVHISGEISNLKCPYSGHLYFVLKDSEAQIKAVLFKGQRKFLAEAVKDGQHVVCHGRVSIYEPRGEYQLIVDTVDFIGAGFLQLKFEKQKQRLAAEGLFASEIKKALPAFPLSILIITSPSGAAIHDFLAIARKRKNPATIHILPVRVQGEGAAEEIAAALDRADRDLNPDIIVLCRGGGSIEDLWAFNEECVARAIHRARTPVVTGIGHEIDFTIADFCADFRAPTPTGAAERILPDATNLLALTGRLQERLTAAMCGKLAAYSRLIASYRRVLGNLGALFENAALKLDLCMAGLIRAMQERLQHHASVCTLLDRRLQHQAPAAKIASQQQQLHFLSQSLEIRMTGLLERKMSTFQRCVARFEAVSPLSTLARGYAIASKVADRTGSGEILRDSDQIAVDEHLDVQLYRGRLRCRVTGKE